MRLRMMTCACTMVLLSVSADVTKATDTDEPQEAAASQPAEQARKPRELTVAILDFSAHDPAMPELGSQISDVMTAMLSGEPGFTLVERATLTRILQEHELNLSGIVDQDQAVKIGKVVGARILVTGKAFAVSQQIYITAKLIGTETTLVEATLVKGESSADVGELVMKLAVAVGDKLRTAGPKLVADDEAGQDPLPGLKKELVKRKLPTVAVIVTEEHMARQRPIQPVDPAVETEIKKLLRECGFTIVDIEQNELAEWARLLDKDHVDGWPRSLRRADVVITGEAFSEFGARIGNLVSCSARAEINVIDRKDGKIVLADRETSRGVDLSENIAGKTALQKAGRAVALRILRHYTLKNNNHAPLDPDGASH